VSDSKETILNRLLTNTNDEYDKSEGSFFYDVETPIAIELEKAYADQEAILDKGFADTATGNYLNRIVGEQGLTRKDSMKASTIVTIIGNVGATISIGQKVASDNVSYVFAENKTIPSGGSITVNVECETAGTIGNVPIGAIKYFPVTLSGVTSVTNTLAVTNGYDEETDEELRERYYEKVRTPATSGNKYQYKAWAKEVTGVGDAKVFPLWNGNGTVKVVIINSNKRAADSTLITNTASYIEDNRPIGATVTIISGSEKLINISVSLTIDTTKYTVATVKASIEATITEYFKSVAFASTYVSYATIGNLIYNTQGVIDYSNLLVNSGTANVTLTDEQVPVLGGVTVG
jgi:uncharacterized phage protein gp47/JayE